MARRKQFKPLGNTSNQEKKRKRMVLIFGVVMIGLLIFSMAGVINSNPLADTDMEYGEYEFELEDRANGGSVLTTTMNGNLVEFQNLPPQVAYLDVDPVAISLMQTAQQIVLVSDPTMELQAASFVDYARLQLSLATGKTGNAIIHEVEGSTLPVVNCSQANAQISVVIFEVTNETSEISLDGLCIYFKGQDRDFMRLKDRMIFEYVGIMTNGVVNE